MLLDFREWGIQLGENLLENARVNEKNPFAEIPDSIPYERD